MPEASVVVVVVTYNSAHVVGDLLDSLPAAAAGVPLDVVAVDNGSTDTTVDVIEGRRDCRLVRSTNVGYAAGINRGVRSAAPAPAILVLNPDVRLTPGSIPAMRAALELPHTGVVAPQVRGPDGTLHHSLRRAPSLGRALGLNFTGWPRVSEYVGRDAEYLTAKVVDWALGAVLMVSRSCYDTVGGWDESYFLYSEETDFSLRARDLGFVTRYEPRAVAVHIGGQSGQDDTTHAMQIVNRVRLYRRRHGAGASWVYFGLTVASELSWLARGHQQSKAAISALVNPRRRPAQLECADALMPR